MSEGRFKYERRDRRDLLVVETVISVSQFSLTSEFWVSANICEFRYLI